MTEDLDPVARYRALDAEHCGFKLVQQATELAVEDLRTGAVELSRLRPFVCARTRKEYFPPLGLYRALVAAGIEVPNDALLKDAARADAMLADLREARDLPQEISEKFAFRLLYCALLDFLENPEGEPDFLAEVFDQVRVRIRKKDEIHVHLPHWAAHAAVYASHPGVECEFEWIKEQALRFLDFFGLSAPDSVLRHCCANLYLRVAGVEKSDPLYDAIKKWRDTNAPPWDVLDQYPLSEVLAVTDVLAPKKAGEASDRRVQAALARMSALKSNDIDRWNARIARASEDLKLVDRSGLPLITTAAQLDETPRRLDSGGDFPNPKHWRRQGTKGTFQAVRFLGGSAIGKTCVLLRFSSGSLLLDFGAARPGPDAWSRFEELRTVEAALISHVHFDHIGGLFNLFGDWKHNIPWFSLPQNRHLARIVLEDSARRDTNSPNGGSAYTDAVDQILDHFVPVNPFERVEVLPGVTASAWPAGHVAGAASWLVEAQGVSLFFTGDYCLRPLLSVDPYRWPSADVCREVDIFITEGTYADGDVAFIDGEQSRRELRDSIRGLRRDGGQVLVPVLSLGRAQEVIRCLEGTPWKVGLFGMAGKVTREVAMDVPANVKIMDKANVDMSSFDVIVASNGSLRGGVSQKVYETPPETGCEHGNRIPVILTGHQFPGTLGRRLRDTGEAKMVRFSAHASAPEIDDALAMFPHARPFLIHFPGSAARVMQRHPQIEIPVGQRIYRESDVARTRIAR